MVRNHGGLCAQRNHPCLFTNSDAEGVIHMARSPPENYSPRNPSDAAADIISKSKGQSRDFVSAYQLISRVIKKIVDFRR